jgi:hypothetical protein
MAVHPSQVPVINEVFTPTPDEVERARRIVAAFDASQAAGEAAFRLDGRMVDAPVVARARRVLEMTFLYGAMYASLRSCRTPSRTALLARPVARLLPPAERHVVVEPGRRQVHHHETALGVRLKWLACFSDVVDDARPRADTGSRWPRERFVVVLHANHRRDRSEDLLAC